jgi:mRNA-degrading endonuclease toxin of MazEF toxin-antitoxin module
MPFTSQTGSKLRPALVVSVETFHRKLPDIIVCPVSSQPRYFQRPGPGDHPLTSPWSPGGLREAFGL